MNKKDARQKKILSYLVTKGQAPLSDILRFLGESVSHKTLQRDVRLMLEQGYISRKGTGPTVVYFLSPENMVRYPVSVTNYFATKYQDREVKDRFDFAIFDLLQNPIFTPEELEELEKLHGEFVLHFSQYDSQTLINKEYQRIMIEFSWKSSEIEGNTYSLLNTESLLLENTRDTSKTEAETQMILNHKDAFNECIQNKDRFIHLSLADLEYVHGVLTKHLGIEKNIRNVGVGITGSKYRPLDNGYQIREALEKMINLINEKDSPFEKSFLSLILLSYIQAFKDGNKRTARMFSNAILLAYQSIPLSYRIVDVVEYKKASLLFYEQNNLSYMKKIYLDQFRDAVEDYFIPHYDDQDEN